MPSTLERLCFLSSHGRVPPGRFVTDHGIENGEPQHIVSPFRGFKAICWDAFRRLTPTATLGRRCAAAEADQPAINGGPNGSKGHEWPSGGWRVARWIGSRARLASKERAARSHSIPSRGIG